MGIDTGKADAVAATIEGTVASIMPASTLQHHLVAKPFFDKPTATKLQLADYYRWVYDGKPGW